MLLRASSLSKLDSRPRSPCHPLCYTQGNGFPSVAHWLQAQLKAGKLANTPAPAPPPPGTAAAPPAAVAAAAAAAAKGALPATPSCQWLAAASTAVVVPTASAVHRCAGGRTSTLSGVYIAAGVSRLSSAG